MKKAKTEKKEKQKGKRYLPQSRQRTRPHSQA